MIRSLMTRGSVLALALFAAACSGAAAPAGVPTGPRPATRAGFPGFDTSLYPGDQALRTWRRASPYGWVGYYLPAPCHRDVSWSGKREALIGMGWGTAVLYVGQQDWTQTANRVVPATPSDSAQPQPPAQPQSQAQTQPACSSVLLTGAQGAIEGADAAAKTASEGFPSGSVIYLDVERVQTVSPALLDYIRAWTERVIGDGRYVPGIYCHRYNADAINAAVRAVYAAAGKTTQPPFWITSSAGYSLDLAPTGIGLPYANVWQGVLHTNETYDGVTLTVDSNVADSRSPSSPRT